MQGRGVALCSLSDGIDPATSTGWLKLNMLTTLADCERELVTERGNGGPIRAAVMKVMCGSAAPPGEVS
ncbi:recombinase family protein [Arthrobacter sp. 1088]|uniref:recombinase family protein n=1 Tax=Arthrobacter sp. 1088 TaxID=2817768 RepID=UPI00286D605C|nr:recombinase family protein [Arthrobacter sp. 1088]